MSKSPKLREIGLRLERVTSTFRSIQAEETADALEAICSLMRSHSSLDLPYLTRVLSEIKPVDGVSSAKPSGRAISIALTTVSSLAQVFDAKKGVADMLKELAKAFTGKNLERVCIHDLHSALRAAESQTLAPKNEPNKEIVAEYLQKLNATLGQPSFESLYAILLKDKRVRAIEAAAIASDFVSPTPKSAKRGASLQRIKARHDNFVDSDQKEEVLAVMNRSGGRNRRD